MRGPELMALLEKTFTSMNHPEIKGVRRSPQFNGEPGLRVEFHDGSACALIDWGHPGSGPSERERPSNAGV